MFVPQSFLCFLGEAQLKRPWSWQFCSKQSSDHQNPFINEGWYSLWILLLCFFTVVEIYLLLSYLGLCRDLSLSPSIAPWLFVSFGILWFFCHTNKACVFCFASIFFVIIMQTQNWRRSKKKKIIIIIIKKQKNHCQVNKMQSDFQLLQINFLTR